MLAVSCGFQCRLYHSPPMSLMCLIGVFEQSRNSAFRPMSSISFQSNGLTTRRRGRRAADIANLARFRHEVRMPTRVANLRCRGAVNRLASGMSLTCQPRRRKGRSTVRRSGRDDHRCHQRFGVDLHALSMFRVFLRHPSSKTLNSSSVHATCPQIASAWI
jgi:hypothetical protein